MSTSPWAMRRISPKLLLTHLMLRSYEFEKDTAENFVQAIKTGEESFLHQGVNEDALVTETLAQLEAMQKEKDLTMASQKYKNFFGL